jgi:hypothetical protein
MKAPAMFHRPLLWSKRQEADQSKKSGGGQFAGVHKLAAARPKVVTT